jgi:predicted acylesterase/phospholipase RssA
MTCDCPATFADLPELKTTLLAAAEGFTNRITDGAVIRLAPARPEEEGQKEKVLSRFQRQSRGERAKMPLRTAISPASTDPGGLALILSGGGFRATLFHLGVISYLYEANLLHQVKLICAVSGGSILAGHLAVNWAEYTGTERSFEAVSDELINFARIDVRGQITRRQIATRLNPLHWITGGRVSCVQRLHVKLFDTLYHGATLSSQRKAGKYGPGNDAQAAPEIHILTTNLGTGRACVFNNEGFIEYHDDQPRSVIAPYIRLAYAVAASSALPNLLPPIRLTAKDFELPSSDLSGPQYLVDGGIVDSLGLNHFHRLSQRKNLDVDHVLLCDAHSRLDVPTDESNKLLARALDVAINYEHQPEYRQIAQKTDGGSAFYISCRLTDIVDQSSYPGSMQMDEFKQRVLARMRTDLDMFSRNEIGLLIVQGHASAKRAVTKAMLTVAASEGLSPVLRKEMYGATEAAFPLRNSSNIKWRCFALRDPFSWISATLSLVYIVVVSCIFMSPVIFYIAWRDKSAEEQIQKELSNTKAQLSELTEKLRTLDRSGPSK